MTREEIINGLKMSIGLMLFDPTTGEVKEPHQLNDMDRTSYEAFKGAMEILAQPQRMRGRWIYGSPVTMKCDQCGCYIADWKVKESNFCYNCGAQMNGGEQDDEMGS